MADFGQQKLHIHNISLVWPAATVIIRINTFLGYPHESPTKPSFAITVTGPHPELILQGSASSSCWDQPKPSITRVSQQLPRQKKGNFRSGSFRVGGWSTSHLKKYANVKLAILPTNPK